MARQPRCGKPESSCINKLVVVVTDACNLRCVYCYARLSPNGSVAGRMTPETARLVMRQFLSGRESCELIQFFGGEPTLNLDAIEAAVEETLDLVNSGALQNRPRFAVVTNGVVSNPKRFLDLLTRYGMETTVSLDGPAFLHDQLRPYANAAPSYDHAVATVAALVQARLPVAIETVFTARHVEAEFSIVNVFEFCKGLGVNQIIFDIAYPPAPAELNPLLDPYFERTLAYHREAVDTWFRDLLAGQHTMPSVYFRDLLLPLLEGLPAIPPVGRCAAGEADFAIGPTGDLYSCQLLYGNREYRVGNVLSGEYPGAASALPIGSADYSVCSNCFARHWCQPCAALNGACGDIWQPPERLCKLRRAVVLQIGRWAFGYLAVPENEVTSILREAVNQSKTAPTRLPQT
jgi:uncharacterized protein